MPTKEELLEAIRECEQRTPSYSNCEKLLTFRSLLKDLYPDPDPENKIVEDRRQSFAVSPTNKSEFMEAIADKDMMKVLDVLDEHMKVAQVLFPKEYQAVLSKIRNM